MSLIYHPAAEAEVLEAGRFYERRVPGLGYQFRDELDAAIQKISKAPDCWRVFHKDFRRFILPRFPYSIIYRVEGKNIRILAVKHHSRHPDYWKGRIAD